ncbi:MAG: hypothetical protein ACTSRP_21270 [Candidatus Helarchaeota archaeon]
MLVAINKKSLEDCKKEVKEVLKGGKFREIGGYLIGTYDYDFFIELFFLDKNAESTPTRIKLSSDTFFEVEKLLKKFPNFQYLGTWHVHPGKGIPEKSQIDESSLFLERFILETDNPEKYSCPKIHIIFNQDFSKVKCYTMDVNIDVDLIEVEDLSRNNINLNILEEIKNKISMIEIPPNEVDIDDLDEIYNSLVDVRDMIDSSLDSIESIIVFEEFKETFYNNTEIIEDIILSNIRENNNIGILAVDSKNRVIGLPYRPANFDPADLDAELFGFWKYFPYSRIDPSFEKIFLANFFLKLDNEYSNQFFYFRCNKELRIEPFVVRYNSYDGVDFIEVEVNIIEEENTN